MGRYFRTETDVSQNLINIFFLTWTVRRPFHRKDFKRKKKYGSTGVFSEKAEALNAELNERPEAATSSYSAAIDFFMIYLFGACD